MALLEDLVAAYYDARRHKRKTHTQMEFEINLERNLHDLYVELRDRTYTPSSAICFVITDPKKREVFASPFRDRVVHHLYYNYIVQECDKRFIYDSYSCRVGKGTLFGIKRLEHHIRSVSKNYMQKAYVLKLDLQGYFMSIPRNLLQERVQMMIRKILPYTKLPEDIQLLVVWLTDVFTLHNPLADCRMRGARSDWNDLPPSKSLWHSPQGVGLPIGDLTSQLYSNIFLDSLDHYITDTLHFRHYGRYVDDFCLLSESRDRLQSAIEPIRAFLAAIGMTLHPRKIVLQPVSFPARQKNVPALEFLGALIYPFYRHCTHRTIAKYHVSASRWATTLASDITSREYQTCYQSCRSYQGYFSHFRMREYLYAV